MGTYPHHVGPQQDQSTGRPESDADPRIPRPLPEADRRGSSRAGLAVMLVALAIIVLVVLL